jgi:site-specific DNA-methyltransferase (adenine-specific)
VQTNLFPVDRPSQQRDPAQHQYLTPEWAADELLAIALPDLGERDRVLEPSCGAGAWLKAVPEHVEAVGVEIDPALAEEARLSTGRRIICGDFRTCPIDLVPTVIVGNPPYRTRLVDAFLDRSHELLPAEGRCGFLLSCHLLQTPAQVMRWAARWSMQHWLVPRTLFPRAIRPLAFVLFTKTPQRTLRGFALYPQAADLRRFPNQVRLLLIHGEPGRSCWSAVVEWGLRRCGGQATLQELYQVIQPHRPTGNPWWREKIRQNLQRYHRPIARGQWAIKEKANG